MKKILWLLISLMPGWLMANSWQCFFEQNYYTTEQSAQLVLIPSPEWRGLEVAVSINGVTGVDIQKRSF